MKEYLLKELKPILIGILAYIIFYSTNELYAALLIKTGIIKVSLDSSSSSWHPLLIISNVLATAALIAPGLLAGWYSKNNGILTASFVVTFCYITVFLLRCINLNNFSPDFLTFCIMLQGLITPVAVGIVSGAAGQYFKKERLSL